MRTAIFGTLVLCVGGVFGAAGSLQQVTANIGPNPNNVGMYVYKPARLASPLPLIVAIHYCTGSAQAYFSGTQYANLADTNGYIVVYPNSPRSGSCFDVNTPQTLSHNGGGDSQGIASMITYAISTYGVDPNHVFVTGSSSGAMMTNVMSGSYPNLFQAASAYSGVPFGCFAGASAWNSACANGQTTKTAAQWGDLVRAAYPGYTGRRPRMLLWHGTADTTLYYNNYPEEIKEWTNVLGVSQTATTTTANNPSSGYTKTTYGDQVLGYSGQGVGHTVPVHEAIDLAFFGITSGSPLPPNSTPVGPTSTSTSTSSSSSSSKPSSSSSSTKPSSSSTPSPPTSSSTVNTTGAGHWDQCGGIGWTGATTCVSPYTCNHLNDWYYQCL